MVKLYTIWKLISIFLAIYILLKYKILLIFYNNYHYDIIIKKVFGVDTNER